MECSLRRCCGSVSVEAEILWKLTSVGRCSRNKWKLSAVVWPIGLTHLAAWSTAAAGNWKRLVAITYIKKSQSLSVIHLVSDKNIIISNVDRWCCHSLPGKAPHWLTVTTWHLAVLTQTQTATAKKVKSQGKIPFVHTILHTILHLLKLSNGSWKHNRVLIDDTTYQKNSQSTSEEGKTNQNLQLLNLQSSISAQYDQ